MSFTADYVDEGRGLRFEGQGALTCEQIIVAKRRLLVQVDRLQPVSHARIVLEHVTEFPLTADDIRLIVDVDREIARYVPHAVVAIAAAMDLPFGVARMWQMLAEDIGWTIAVFRSRTLADEWLHSQLAALGLIPGVTHT
jgi:hypothetical protein